MAPLTIHEAQWEVPQENDSDILDRTSCRALCSHVWACSCKERSYTGEHNTERNVGIHISHWARFEPAIPMFEHLKIVLVFGRQQLLVLGTSALCFSGQHCHVLQNATLATVMLQWNTCSYTAQQSLPKRELQVDYQQFLSVHGRNRFPPNWEIDRTTGDKGVRASETNFVASRCHSFLSLLYFVHYLFLKSYYIFWGLNKEATSRLLISSENNLCSCNPSFPTALAFANRGFANRAVSSWTCLPRLAKDCCPWKCM